MSSAGRGNHLGRRRVKGFMEAVPLSWPTALPSSGIFLLYDDKYVRREMTKSSVVIAAVVEPQPVVVSTLDENVECRRMKWCGSAGDHTVGSRRSNN